MLLPAHQTITGAGRPAGLEQSMKLDMVKSRTRELVRELALSHTTPKQTVRVG